MAGIGYVARSVSNLSDPPVPSDTERAFAREAEIVSNLRPGGHAADLPILLGEPPVSRSVEGSYRRLVFILDFSAVLAIADRSGEILLTSVTSLQNDFQPTFRLDNGATVTLWRSPVTAVQTVPTRVAGFTGANSAYYFEWTPDISHSTNYRQSMYGYSLTGIDETGEALAAFAPFDFTRTDEDTDPTDMGIPESGADRNYGLVRRWLSWRTAQVFRERLPVNTVAFQAAGVEPLSLFPAVRDSEAWGMPR